MRPSMELTQVFLYQQPIDFRKAHLGLSALIECELGHDPFAGHLYAFTNKRRNKIKCLFWEDNGFPYGMYKFHFWCLFYKKEKTRKEPT